MVNGRKRKRLDKVREKIKAGKRKEKGRLEGG